MADSHMTPIDSGLGSIYSVAMSSVTQPSFAPAQTCEKADDKGSDDVAPSHGQSDTKEHASSPVDKVAGSCKDVEPPKTEMVATETQTSPTTEVCPILFVKAANADDKELSGSLPAAGSGDQESQLQTEDNIKPDSIKSVVDNDDKEKNAIFQLAPLSSLLQVKQDEASVTDANPNNVPEKEKANLSAKNEDQTDPNKTPSPVLVTVSSEKGDDDKTVSISESLR